MGAYRTTPDGGFLDVNRSGTALLGFSGREELVGVAASSLYLDGEQREAWRRLVEAAAGAAAMELRIRRADGSVIWVRDTGHAVRDAAGRVQYYEGILEHLTEGERSAEAPAAGPSMVARRARAWRRAVPRHATKGYTLQWSSLFGSGPGVIR